MLYSRGYSWNRRRLLGGFVGLLDTYPDAAAAYSLRKLRADYSGSAVRVRKEVSSVSSETDIGFLDDGSLDTATLLTFASDADSGDVFVETWYDQSGSITPNDATQGTAADQPKIVDSGSLVVDNQGIVGMDFDGVDDEFDDAYDNTGKGADFYAYAVGQKTEFPVNAATRDAMFGIGVEFYLRFTESAGGEIEGRLRQSPNSTLFTADKSISGESAPFRTLADMINADNEFVVGFNGSDSIAIDTTALTALDGGGVHIGTRTGADSWKGIIQEHVIWFSDQSENRAAIQSEVASNYVITLA